MADDTQGKGPLPSSDLERDRQQSGQTGVKPGDSGGHTLPASEANMATGEESDEDKSDGDKLPAAGTILPPD